MWYNSDVDRTATSTRTFTYGDSGWGDLLTNYYGDEIVYDTIGNPIRIGMYDSDFDIWYVGYELEWNGRQLTSYREFMEDDGIFYGSTYTYQYNADGIRTSKTVNGIEHKYYLNGSQILAETWKQGNVEHLLIFVYDENGSPIALKYRTNAYAENTFDFFFYEKNLQGDIIGIFNTNGRRVGWYIYDAWGTCSTYVASSTSTLEQNVVRAYNPYRYRGYYYDTETQLYYLQSRYYNPAWGRFLNADGYINANGDILGYNMFAYCGNNPVMGYDPTGEWNWSKFFSGANLLAVGAMAVATAATVLTCGAASPLMVGVAAVTATAGLATAVNGVAEVVEAGTDYNIVRDGLMGGDAEAYETYKNVTQTVAEVGTMITGSYIAANGGSVCFIAGTLIATENGLVPIEDIRPGDLVWATDEKTGETALKEVVQLFRNETEEWIHIFVNGEELICTPEHPFYSPVKGWTSAIDLRAGDILVMLNGEYVVVEQVQHELLESSETTYNFEVEDFHTYHVGEDCVLVHNSCAHKSSSWRKQKSDYWKSHQNTVSDLYELSPSNQALMAKGKAPFGYDGYRIELHHVSGINNSSVITPMTKASHTILHKFVGYKDMIDYALRR